MRLIVLTLLGGCTAAPSMLSEADHPPFVSPCDASEAPFLAAYRLTCSIWPSSPTFGPGDTWGEAKPKRRRTESLTGEFIDGGEYDYTKSGFPHATYRPDGNIESVTFPEQFPGIDPMPTIHYGYDGATLTNAFVTEGDSRTVEVEISYAEGRRASELVKDSAVQGFVYTYDDAGRVVSRRGAGSSLPAVATSALTDAACRDPSPEPAPSEALAFVGATYFLRGTDGRVLTTIRADGPGRLIEKQTYEYDAEGRLNKVTQHCSDSHEPDRQPQVWIYEY